MIAVNGDVLSDPIYIPGFDPYEDGGICISSSIPEITEDPLWFAQGEIGWGLTYAEDFGLDCMYSAVQSTVIAIKCANRGWAYYT